MKSIFSLHILIFCSIFFANHLHTLAQDNFSAEFIRVECYDDDIVNRCSTHPVYVREIFKIDGITNYADIALIEVLDGKKIESQPVMWVNDEGYVVRSYCSTNSFSYNRSIYFINIKGGMSNKLYFNVDISRQAIQRVSPPALTSVR